MAKEHAVKESSGEMGGHGDWIASGGMGLTVSPTLFLISPQMEYVARPNLLVGPLIQMGLGDAGVLFSAEVTGRYILGHHPPRQAELGRRVGDRGGFRLFCLCRGSEYPFWDGIRLYRRSWDCGRDDD